MSPKLFNSLLCHLCRRSSWRKKLNHTIYVSGHHERERTSIHPSSEESSVSLWIIVGDRTFAYFCSCKLLINLDSLPEGKERSNRISKSSSPCSPLSRMKQLRSILKKGDKIWLCFSYLYQVLCTCYIKHPEIIFFNTYHKI